jgi:hypothetical protein
MMVKAFQTSIFPYLVEIGVILFVYSIISLGYTMFRKPDFQNLVERLRGYIVAYMLVKGAFVIVNFINRMIDGIK